MLRILLGSLALQLFSTFSVGLFASEQDALLQFHAGLTVKPTWDTTQPLCGQTGITCSGEYVTKISLGSRLLKGTIATQLGTLAHLQELNLMDNSLTGAIPTELGLLSNLKVLFLSYNSLTGTIPTHLGLLGVQNLYLERNKLTGTIPSQLGSIALQNMYLYGNSLTGTIPPNLGSSYNLQDLRIHDNHLGGTIPADLLAGKTITWLMLRGTNNFCPLITYSSWAQSTDSPSNVACTACVSSSPLCMNGGTCNGGYMEFFSCSCTPGYEGYVCQTGSPLIQCAAETVGLATWPLTNASSTATGTCAAGYAGTLSRSCSAEGVWTEPTGTCLPLCTAVPLHRYASWPATAPGTSASGTCMFGYSGVPTRLCREDSTWEIAVQDECTRTICPTVEEGGFTWPSRQSGNIVNFLCPVGFAGRPWRTCLETGEWSAINDPCTEKSCPAVASYQTAAWPLTSRGQVATGTCTQGYSGTITRNCKVEGYWSPTVQGGCERDKCAAEVADNASWRATTAELTATGRCVEGFSGSPTRQCQADATWAAIQDPCTRNQCPASSADEGTFVTTDSLTTATGTCTLPFKGTPTRQCKADGTWGPIVSPCSLDCSPSTYGHATWPATSGSRYASGTCDEGFASSKGVPKRFCNQDGTWSSNIVYVCLNKKCPSVEEGGVTWPSTSTFSTAAVSCPSGRILKARRECRSDATWDVIQNPCE